MAFSVNQPKQVSQWVNYDFDGESKTSKFKIRGVKYKPYLIAQERIQTLFGVHGIKIDNIGDSDFSSQEMVFKIVAEYLIEDWQDVEVEIGGEVKAVPYDKDIALDMMRYGGIDGLQLWDFVMKSAHKIQTDADNYKEEVLGKSEVSTDGKSTERKPAKSQRNKPTSTNG